ncbi:MAG TPA: hypothetical protein VG929_10535 [Actinomycetota bacterium]|nr:hypothetical protein [Actinomycetota bacterium]
MVFRWILHDESGTDLRASEDFSSQDEAEAWMGSDWASLLEEGAESVTLMDDGAVVYRMGLREE